MMNEYPHVSKSFDASDCYRISISLAGAFPLHATDSKCGSKIKPTFICQTYHVTFQGLLELCHLSALLGTHTWIQLWCSPTQTHKHTHTHMARTQRHFESDKWAHKYACIHAHIRSHNKDSSMCITLSHLKAAAMFKPITNCGSKATQTANPQMCPH